MERFAGLPSMQIEAQFYRGECMKKKDVISISLYLLGVTLFVIANSTVVSGSPIHLTYFQRGILCSAAVCSIGVALFIYQSKTRVGMVMKFIVAVALIWCILHLVDL